LGLSRCRCLGADERRQQMKLVRVRNAEAVALTIDGETRPRFEYSRLRATRNLATGDGIAPHCGSDG
jgi:hypothetical protein